MANLITQSLSFSKENIQELFITPFFVDGEAKNDFTVRTNIKTNEKLDKLSSLSKVVKGYSQGTGFTPSTGVTLTQRTLTMGDMKAEIEQNGREFLGSVKQELLKSGVEQNDLEGTMLYEIVIALFGDAIRADIARQIWFGGTAKETMTAGVPTATLDADFKEYNGIITHLITDFSTAAIPTAQRVSTGDDTTYYAVAPLNEVDTVTLDAGTTGTADLTINGTAYEVTFVASLTATAAAFVTSHAATLSARFHNIVLTSDGADIVVTNGTKGAKQTLSFGNASDDLAATIVNTQPDAQAGALTTNSAKLQFAAMYAAMPAVMRGAKSKMVIHCDSELVDNYSDTLEALGTEQAHRMLLDGESVLHYRGIPIREHMDWNSIGDTDFEGTFPNMAIMTMKENLVLGVDGESDDMDLELFYNQEKQKNVFRAEFKNGTNYIHAEYIVAAFTA